MAKREALAAAMPSPTSREPLDRSLPFRQKTTSDLPMLANFHGKSAEAALTRSTAAVAGYSTPRLGSGSELPSSRNGVAAAHGVDLGAVLGAVLRKSPLILLLTIIGGCVGIAAEHLITPRYTSAVSLILEPKKADSFGADTIFGSMYVDEAQIASVVSVIRSSDLLARVVKQQRLDLVPEFGAPNRPKYQKWLDWLPLFDKSPVADTPGARIDRALWRLSHALDVERVGFTYVVTVSARAEQPDIAKRIANGVADAYLGDLVERKIAATQRDFGWLTARLEEVRHDLEKGEADVDAVRRKYGLFESSSANGATLDRQAITDLNSQMIRVHADVANLRARYEQIGRAGIGGLDGLDEMEASPLILDLRAKQAEGLKQIAALKATYGGEYPPLQRLENGQRTLQGQIAAERERIIAGRRSNYESAVTRERALQEQLKHAIASEWGDAGDEGHERLRNAQRVAAESRGLYDVLSAKLRDLRQQQTREEAEARVISRADLPDRPSYPKPFLFPLGGAASFFFIALGLTIFPVVTERRFTSRMNAEERLGLPVLASIPLLRKREANGEDAAEDVAGCGLRPPLLQLTESLRLARAVLQISPGGPPAILQVTSAIEGEGKSTLAAAIAASAARARIPTVLIDADIRKGGASLIFGLRGEPGLSDLLERDGEADLFLRRWPNMPLAALGSGTATVPQPEWLESDAFAKLIRELAASWQLVIIDTPPALAVADPIIVSRLVDITILVVGWRSTAQAQVIDALRLLRSVGAPVYGVLLNRVRASGLDPGGERCPAYKGHADARGRSDRFGRMRSDSPRTAPRRKPEAVR